MKVTELKENQVVHCTTHEEAKRVLKLAHEIGMKWSNGDRYLRHDYWDVYKENTCYCISKGIYGPIDFYQPIFLYQGREYEIIPSEKIIDMENKTEFFEERVMEVSDSGTRWYPRVVFGKKNGKYIAWDGADTVEEAEKITGTFTWNYAREIYPFKELKEAYERGEAIQFNHYGRWIDMNFEPKWVCDIKKYRIKPKPKYVPFTYEDAELFMNRVVIAKDKSCKAVITYADGEDVLLCSYRKSYQYLFESYTFLDGSPCGKEAEI